MTAADRRAAVEGPGRATPGTARAAKPQSSGGLMRVSEASDESALFKLRREQVDAAVVARITIDGEPVSKSRARFTKRGSKTHAYTPEKTHLAEQVLGWKFRAAAPKHQLDSDVTYGVVALFFSTTRQRRDVDNMLKLVLDGLNGVAWPDDEQVTEVSGRKEYVPAGEARTEILVYRVGRVYRHTATCAQCDVRFPTYASWTAKRRYCSKTCDLEFRRQRRQRTCAQCGVSFDGVKVEKQPRYCSIACSSAAGRTEVTCSGCGCRFTKQRCHVRAQNYCTDACLQSARRDRVKLPKGTCTVCGGGVSRKEYRRCNACRMANARTQGAPRPADAPPITITEVAR